MPNDGRHHPFLAIIFAVMLGGAGLALGAAAHWYVVDLSDGELLHAARTVHLTGFNDEQGPVLDFGWAPSFTRQSANWDITSDEPPDAERVAADLSAAGWTVTGIEELNGTVTVSAVHGRAAASVHLSPEHDGGTHARLGVDRRSQPPTLQTCLLIGTLAGTAGGARWGWRMKV